MQLSTRGRYTVMALLDLAEMQSSNKKLPVNLSDIAERQDLSLSYLEQLFAKLRKAKIVKSIRGPGGGYLLAKPAQEIWLSDILTAADENVDVTRCGAANLADGDDLPDSCMNYKGNQRCNAHHVWIALSQHIKTFMEQINLQMVLNGEIKPDFKI